MAHPAVRPVLAAVMVAATVPVIATAQASPAVVAENVRHVATVPGATGGHSVIEGNRLYVGSYGTGMRMFDITNPSAPKALGDWRPATGSGGFTPSSSDPGARADAVPDAAVWDGRHIVSLGGTSRAASTTQTEFLDWTDPADPKLLWRFRGAADGEAHNGDIVDARKLFFSSGGSGENGLRIYDMRPLLGETPAAPELVGRFNPVNLWRDSPHRGDKALGAPFTHTHDMEVYVDREVLLPQHQWVDRNGDGSADKTYAKRDIVLLAEGGSYLNNAGNTGSMFIIDVTDPANPVALLRYQRPAGLGKPVRYVHEAQFLEGQPDILITSDEDLHSGCEAGGATIHRVSEDLLEITELAQWFHGAGTPAAVCSTHVMSTKDDFLFLGSYNAGLQVVDLSDPGKPVRAGQYIAAGANSWGALVHRNAPGYTVYVGDFGARGLDVFDFVPAGVSDACQGRDITLAAGEKLVEHTVYMRGENEVGNVDAYNEIVDGAPRLVMTDEAPAGTRAKTFAGKNYVVGPNSASAPNFLLGYWARELPKASRVVCAEAVVYAATTQGKLTLQLWADGEQLTGVAGASTPRAAAPYRVNFGPLDRRVSVDLLVQAVHDTPGSLLYYDAVSRPSWLTYVTVEKA
ncbi:MAG TPA: hypothetical protein VM433_11490 [Mycobacteriales bacterium]|nr:hypothetical protein [Mycobacteriales bacterium]